MARLLKSAPARLAAAALLVGLLAPAGRAVADTSPGPPIPGLACPPEQFPHAGAPRSSPSVPYEIPFTATLGQTDSAGIKKGGYLQVANGTVTATLGGPLTPDPDNPGKSYGTVFANVCGLVSLPSQAGVIPGNPYGYGGDNQANNNFQFLDQPINVELSVTGVPVAITGAYAVADGQLSAQIDPQPAANGGLNVEFYGGAKSTATLTNSELTSLLGLLPGGGTTPDSGASCTLAIGNLLADGVPPADLTTVTGLTYAEATAPVHLTTQTSGTLTGQPVTGPITASDATLVANDFPVAAIDPNTVPAPGSTGTCSSAPLAPGLPSAPALLNELLGLPSPPGKNFFYAPSTFAVYTSS